MAHAQALKDLRDYLVCGGMPQAVAAMSEAKDVQSVRWAHRSILQTYRQDFFKYAPKVKAALMEKLELLKANAENKARPQCVHSLCI